MAGAARSGSAVTERPELDPDGPHSPGGSKDPGVPQKPDDPANPDEPNGTGGANGGGEPDNAGAPGDGADPGASNDAGGTGDGGDQGSARERILSAAGELFAEFGFDATPTSRIAERAGVPKGLIHYYFRRKPDLLVALVERLPDAELDPARLAVPGDVAASLHRLVCELDRRFESSVLLSHLLWREADTHEAVRRELRGRFEAVVRQLREVISAALPPGREGADVDTAALLLARVVHHRHAVARLGGQEPEPGQDPQPEREIEFIARALESS